MTKRELIRAIEKARSEKATLLRAIERLGRLREWSKEHGLGRLARWLAGRQAKMRERLRAVTTRIEGLQARLAAVERLPEWLPVKYAEAWEKPWTVPLDGADEFKRTLWEHGLVSPNFTRREAGGQDRNPQGCAVPESLRGSCQYHAFSLERVRHELGDVSMAPLSWYRCPAHNSAVGGATASQHLKANATDWPDAERARLGGERFDAAMERVFANGGRGYQSFVGGSIRHVDNGPARTWVYA